MGIQPVGPGSQRISTARKNANSLVTKKSISKGQEKETNVHDHDAISLSDQAKSGHKVGEQTGMSGRQGKEYTKSKKDEIQEDVYAPVEQPELYTQEQPEQIQKSPQQLEQELQLASQDMGTAINNLSPENKKELAQLNQQVHKFAAQEEQRTGVPQNRAALLAKAVINNDKLQSDGRLQAAAGNFLQADLANSQGMLSQLAKDNPQAVAADPSGFNAAMQSPGRDPLSGGPGGPGGPGIPGGGPGAPGGPGGPSSTPLTDAANKQKEYQADLEQARTIYAEMAAERQKWMARMWQIIQDTNTKINEIMQQVTLFRAQKSNEMAMKWAEVIRM